jgi:uncharacterized membrane protein SpoIIM required for sporulation
MVAADFCDAMMAVPVHTVTSVAATASLNAVSRLIERPPGKRITNNKEQKNTRFSSLFVICYSFFVI